MAVHLFAVSNESSKTEVPVHAIIFRIRTVIQVNLPNRSYSDIKLSKEGALAVVDRPFCMISANPDVKMFSIFFHVGKLEKWKLSF